MQHCSWEKRHAGWGLSLHEYESQIAGADGFQGRPVHSRLIGEERLFAGVNTKEALQGRLRSSALALGTSAFNNFVAARRDNEHWDGAFWTEKSCPNELSRGRASKE